MCSTSLGKKPQPVTVHGIGGNSTRNTPALIPLPRQVREETFIPLGKETELITLLTAIGSTGRSSARNTNTSILLPR